MQRVRVADNSSIWHGGEHYRERDELVMPDDDVEFHGDAVVALEYVDPTPADADVSTMERDREQADGRERTADTEAAAETDTATTDRRTGDIETLSGVGEKKAEALREAGFGTFAALYNADEDELAAIEKISDSLAADIKSQLVDSNGDTETENESESESASENGDGADTDADTETERAAQSDTDDSNDVEG